jgi:hypothetical protein
MLRARIAAGDSRHDSAVAVAAWAMREAAAGLYPAAVVAEQLGRVFVGALVGSGRGGRAVTPQQAQREWDAILSWAVAQAAEDDPRLTRAQVDARLRSQTSAFAITRATPSNAADGGHLEEGLPHPDEVAPASPATELHDVPALEVSAASALAYRIDWESAYSEGANEIDWLVPGVIERGRLVAMYSAAKAGKSLLMLDVVSSLATGRGVFGLPSSGSRVPVLYCDYENTPADIVARLRDLGHLDPLDLAYLHYLSLPAIPPLDTPFGGQTLLDAALAVKAELVVIDTASRTISGIEDSANTWHAWYSATGLPLKRAEIALVRLDHSGKDESRGQRGSSAKVSDVDLVIRLTVKKDEVHLTAEERRQPYYAERTVLKRHEVSGVLRHELASGPPEDEREIARLIAFLDEEAIPTQTGRPTIQSHLATRGYPATKRLVEEAIRRRKRALQDPETARVSTDQGHTSGPALLPTPPWAAVGQALKQGSGSPGQQP